MRTIRQWLQTLDLSDADIAIKRTIEITGKHRLDKKVPSLELAINSMFIWEKSPEGYEYWAEIDYKYYEREKTKSN